MHINLNHNKIFAEDLEDKKDNLSAENIKIKYASNVNDISIGELDLNIEKIYDGKKEFKADNFLVSAGIKNKSEDYSVFFKTKVDAMNIAGENGIDIEAAYSINHINKSMMQLYKEVTSMYAVGDSFSEDFMVKVRKTILDNLKDGFTFSVDKIKFKDPNNFVNLSGNFEILPLKNKDSLFNFAKQSKFLVNLETEGQFSQIINSVFVGSMDAEAKLRDSNPEIKKPAFLNNKFKLELKYDNNLLTVNNFPAPTMVNYFIFNTLSGVNRELGFEVQESVPVNNNNTTLSQKINQSADNIFKNMEKDLQKEVRR